MSTRQDKGSHGTLREEDSVNAGADPRIDHYATRPDGTVYAVYRPKMIVPDESDPKIYREFWAAAAEALKGYQLTWDKSVDHSAALETLRALAEEHGSGEAEWTEYLYLESSNELAMAHDRGLEPYVKQLELKNKLLGLEPDEAPDLMHYRLQDIYNGDDTDAVKYLLEPVVRFLDWMKRRRFLKGTALSPHIIELRMSFDWSVGFPSQKARCSTMKITRLLTTGRIFSTPHFLTPFHACRTIPRFSQNTFLNRSLPLRLMKRPLRLENIRRRWRRPSARPSGSTALKRGCAD
ncbi:MAG: hypothetical protein OXT69_01130 [Candidatus Poribacteria bacterium]|nr:hypothetical protein [Candidatus Poribacteria bacterium]